MESSEHRVILCTCPSADDATRLARAVVGEQLAACVNILAGVRSIYRWKGEICDDAEFLLVIKTATDRVEALRERLVTLHPYECPEVIALPIVAGHTPYLDWLIEETR